MDQLFEWLSLPSFFIFIFIVVVVVVRAGEKDKILPWQCLETVKKGHSQKFIDNSKKRTANFCVENSKKQETKNKFLYKRINDISLGFVIENPLEHPNARCNPKRSCLK
uniref:ATP synthase F0 subunit 8 n=1 Tax=Panagrolaimus sp. ES5 TaxID=591445 RepID=A0AC34FSG9_9BILA